MKILVLAAHPDDEVYGMGGTIAKLSDSGHHVYTLILTEGCSTQYSGNEEIIDIKKEEANLANEILGVKKVFFCDLPDMRLDSLDHVEINKNIEKYMEIIEPDIVFTHHNGDVNKDHRLIFESTLVATRPVLGSSVKKVYTYQVPSSTEWGAPLENDVFIPNTFIDIERYTDKKRLAIEAYKSELRDFPHPRSVKAVQIYDQAAGIKVGLEYAEAFCLIRAIVTNFK